MFATMEQLRAVILQIDALEAALDAIDPDEHFHDQPLADIRQTLAETLAERERGIARRGV